MSYSTDDQILWTTARCTRLLRPIESRLALLRKNIQTAHTELKRNLVNRSKGGDRGGHFGSTGANEDDHEEKELQVRKANAKDPEWLPVYQSNPKNTMRKYTAKAARPQSQTHGSQSGQGRPGEIALPTPIISRTIKSLVDSPQLGCSPADTSQAAKRRRKFGFYPNGTYLQGLKKTMAADEFKHISGLSDAFVNLLKATSAIKPSSKKTGTRSLISSCLRQVPAYIDLEKQWQKANERDEYQDENISHSIYTELEASNSYAGYGWQSLREILRAHAIRSLCTAMCESVLSAKSIDAFVDLCIQRREWDAARSFLECWSSLQTPMSEPCALEDDLFDEDRRPFYARLLQYAQQTHSWKFLLRQLSSLISSQTLSVNWLGTASSSLIWNRVVGGLANPRSHFNCEASEFLELAVLQGVGIYSPETSSEASRPRSTSPLREDADPQVRSALGNALTSVATMLTSMCILSLHEDENEKSSIVRSSMLWNIQSICQSLNRNTKSGPTNAISQTKRRMAFLASSVLLLRCGIALETAYASVTLESLIQIMSSAPSQTKAAREQMSSLIYEVAKCFDRIQGKNDLAHFDQLVQAVLPRGSSFSRAYERGERVSQRDESEYDESISIFMYQLGYEAALSCAIKSEEQTQFDFANHIKKGLASLRPQSTEAKYEGEEPSGELTRNASAGYRWEEGLSEWITCTPGPALRKGFQQRKVLEALSLTPKTEPPTEHLECDFLTPTSSLNTCASLFSPAHSMSPFKGDIRDDDSHPTLSSMLTALESSPLQDHRNSSSTRSSRQSPEQDVLGQHDLALSEKSSFSLNARLKRHIEHTNNTGATYSDGRASKRTCLTTFSRVNEPVQDDKISQKRQRLALRRALSARVAREFQRKPTNARWTNYADGAGVQSFDSEDDLSSEENYGRRSSQLVSASDESEDDDELSGLDETLARKPAIRQAVRCPRLRIKPSASSLRRQVVSRDESEDELGMS